MSDIVTECSGNILSIQLNRAAKKNAMNSSMYITMAEILDGAAKDDQIRVVLWHGGRESDRHCVRRDSCCAMTNATIDLNDY